MKVKPIIGVDRALQLDFCACKLGEFGLSVFFGACRTAAEGSFFSVPRARVKGSRKGSAMENPKIRSARAWSTLGTRSEAEERENPFRARVEYADLNER